MGTFTGPSLTNMEILTLFGELLAKWTDSLCRLVANSTSHMANSTIFINSLRNMLTKIIAAQLQGQAIFNENASFSIEDSLCYICNMLTDVTALAHTFCEFHGDLERAVQNENNGHVEKVITLTKMCDIVSDIHQSKVDNQDAPQLDDIRMRLTQVKHTISKLSKLSNNSTVNVKSTCSDLHRILNLFLYLLGKTERGVIVISLNQVMIVLRLLRRMQIH